jgi:uncharacterized membrane protein required for colicin V production
MFMNWLLDILFVLIFLLIVVVSTQKGFVKSIWRTVTVIGSFVVAYIFAPVIGEWICDNFVHQHVTSYAYGVVAQLVENNAGEYNVSGLFETLPEEFTQLLAHCGTSVEELSSRFSVSLTVSEDELYSMAESIAMPISRTLSNAVAIISVFLVSILAFALVGLVLKLVVKMPIIHSLDSVLGCLFGVGEGLVIVWILCLLVGLFVEHSFMSNSSNEVLYSLTEGSRIFNFFCELSPIDFINIKLQ